MKLPLRQIFSVACIGPSFSSADVV
jgi:hypothetical protein